MKRLVIAAAASLLACSSWSPDPDLFGLHLENRSEQGWTKRDDFKPRLRTVVAASLTHIGATPADVSGLRLVVKDGEVDCVATMGKKTGCYDPLNRTLTVSTDEGYCVERLVITHELRHAVFGDPWHQGGGWGALDELPKELEIGHFDCLSPLLQQPWPPAPFSPR